MNVAEKSWLIRSVTTSEANSSGTLLGVEVRVNYIGKVFQNRRYRRVNDLSQASNRSHFHGVEKLVHGFQVFFRRMPIGPARQQIDKFLRTDATRNALTARFVAKKARRVDRHVQHAAPLGANDDRARANHGTCVRDGFEIER